MDKNYLLIDYSSLVTEIRDDVLAEGSLPHARILPRLELFVESTRSETLRGDAVVARLFASFEMCGLRRTSTQRYFHKKFTEGILPWIYGKKEFGKFKERILHEHGIHPDKYNQYTLISTPRRWGKTTSVAIFVAGALFSVPDLWISVYSTGKRASKALSDQVNKYILKIEEAASYKKSRIIVKNTEELFYQGATASDVRRLYSYPATVQVRTPVEPQPKKI